MSPVILDILGVQVRWYGLMYVVAIIVGIVLVNLEIKRRGLKKEGKGGQEVLSLDDILDFVLITIPIAIIGARLYYVIFSWHHYGQNLGDIYKIWEGGLAIHGGLLGGAIALLIFCKWKKINFWKFADIIAPAVVLGQSLGRFGNFMNGDAYGVPTDAPWGIVFPSTSPAAQAFSRAYTEVHLHPTMLYEMGGDLIIFGLLMLLRLKPFRDGFLISAYVMAYSALRFTVEFFRGDPLCFSTQTSCLPYPADQALTQVGFFGSLRVAQVISVILFAYFAFVLIKRKLYVQDNTESGAESKHATHEKPEAASQ
jgi:phosphatidylglycerol:prolipoprotein diacylglycerol transferase